MRLAWAGGGGGCSDQDLEEWRGQFASSGRTGERTSSWEWLASQRGLPTHARLCALLWMSKFTPIFMDIITIAINSKTQNRLVNANLGSLTAVQAAPMAASHAPRFAKTAPSAASRFDRIF